MVFLDNCYGLKDVSLLIVFYDPPARAFFDTAKSPAVEHARDLIAQIPDWLEAHDDDPEACSREKKHPE